MLRAFLVLFAVLVAVLAFVFDRLWLYAAALVPLVGVMGMVGWRLWSRYRSHQRRSRSAALEPDEEKDLEDLGIVDVRPQEHGAQEDDEVEPPDDAEADAVAPDTSVSPAPGTGGTRRTPTPASPAPPAPDRAAVARTDTETEGDKVEAAPTPKSSPDTEPSALRPLLASVRAALDAQTVCLLVQEEVVLEYRIQACASNHPAARTEGTFETQAPLLTATMSRQPVTVCPIDDEARADLGYYTDPPASLAQMAVAPVPRPDDATTVFLVADASAETELDTSRARTLLEHFAETAQLLLSSESDPRGAETDPALAGNGQHHEAASSPSSTSSGSGESPRPRRDIIAEEMEAANAAEGPLSLVLVHLNRAEAIARQGDDAVASTERLLRARLEQAAPGQRVDRFGELTYGIFVRQGPADVEDWAIDLKETMDAETGDLEGGVSVGIAVRGDSHTDPEHLRADATAALRESYETGTCAIVA